MLRTACYHPPPPRRAIVTLFSVMERFYGPLLRGSDENVKYWSVATNHARGKFQESRLASKGDF